MPEFPRGLKPLEVFALFGAAKAAPFQNIGCDSIHSEIAPFQKEIDQTIGFRRDEKAL